MSSAVVSTSAALGRPFVFDDEEAEVRSGKVLPSTNTIQQSSFPAISNRKSAIENSVIPASRLGIRPAPEMVSSGIPAIDALTGGLPRGCLTEICGSASSGRTTLLLAALAAATAREECCVVVDASDALDPHSAAAAGVELDRLLWVRCCESSPRKSFSPQRHRDTEKTFSETISEKRVGSGNQSPQGFSINNQKSTIKTFSNRQSEIGNRKFPDPASEHCLEQAVRATDLLLESGGFGLIVLDLGDIPSQAARRIPLTTWFRFRRAVEYKPTILLAIEQQPIAGSCSSLLLQFGATREQNAHAAHPSHAHLLMGMDISARLICSRLERKPARSVTFASKTAWAG